MRCPKCYGSVDKESKVCLKCGFDTKKLADSSNKRAKELLRSGDGDLVLQSRVLPKDLNKKKLLLFCGFLGLFGGHYFYCGKFTRGIVNLIISLYCTVFLVFSALHFKGDKIYAYFEYFALLLFGFVLIFTIWDFFDIVFNRFKVPVYVDEKAKTKGK